MAGKSQPGPFDKRGFICLGILGMGVWALRHLDTSGLGVVNLGVGNIEGRKLGV